MSQASEFLSTGLLLKKHADLNISVQRVKFDSS